MCRYLGVFPKDTIPSSCSLTSFPTCFVSNTDVSSLPGSHWVAVYYPSSKDECEFFDSYSLSPTSYGFDSLANTVKTSNIPIQSLNASTCGQYCIYYLHKRSFGHTFDSILHSFSHSDLIQNDYLVTRFVHKLVRITRPLKMRLRHSYTSTPCHCCKPRYAFYS